jgi:hypothetical protein
MILAIKYGIKVTALNEFVNTPGTPFNESGLPAAVRGLCGLSKVTTKIWIPIG